MLLSLTRRFYPLFILLRTEVLLKAGFTTAVVPHQPLVVWRLPLQTPVESPSHAAVLNPSWFCQDFSFFSSVV